MNFVKYITNNGKIEALHPLVYYWNRCACAKSSCRAIWPYDINIPRRKNDNNYFINIEFVTL